MAEQQFAQIIKEIQSLSYASDIENALLTHVQEAFEQQNIDLAKLLLDYVIEQDKISIEIRMNALAWLTDSTIEELQQAANEDESNEIFRKLIDCLWKHKWLVYKLPLNPDLTLEQIQSHSDRMKELYEIGNFSLAPVYKTFMLQNMNMGYRELAKENFQKWQETEEDILQDCEACELTEQVNYHNFIGDYQTAIQKAQPLLDRTVSCVEACKIVYFPAINSYIESGQWDKAQHYLNIAIDELKDDNDLIEELPKIMQLAVKLGQYPLAEQLANDHGQKILDRGAHDALIQLDYYIATAKFDPQSHQKALALAAYFDKRNKNTFYSDNLQHVLQGIAVH